MEVKKIKKTHAHYEPDFKEEILRMRIAAQLNFRRCLCFHKRHLRKHTEGKSYEF